MEFAERIKMLREKKGLSTRAVAEKLNIAISTYHDWELGRQIRGEGPYIKLAEVFDVSLNYLLTGKSAGPNDITQKLDQLEEIVRELRQLTN